LGLAPFPTRAHFLGISYRFTILKDISIMALVMPERFASPEARASLFYVSFFLPAAVQTLLLPIWLDSRGISEEQIGTIAAVPIALMIVFNLVVGRIADKASDWRSVIVAASVIAGLASLGFLFVDGYWGILIVVSLCVIPMMATEPVIDTIVDRLRAELGAELRA
jgi:PPP family 3-phenylpropionic acid transporter